MSRNSEKSSPEILEPTVPNRVARRTLLAGAGAAAVGATLPVGAAHATRPSQLRAGATVTPQEFGAKADGATDDTAAINQAIQDLYDAGGGTLHLPAGTYLLGTVTPALPGAPARFATLIIPKSGVTIEGEGDATVLLAADGLSAVGNWNFIHPPHNFDTDPLENVEFRDFKLDGNGENNLDVNANRWNVVGARHGSQITIDNVTIVNNASRQCIQFGNNTMPHTVTNLTIRNCHLTTVGGAVDGNDTQTDHSSIYAQANGCTIQNNVLTQPKLTRSNQSTAIEVHSSNGTVSGNQITNYRGGMNVVAIVTDHVNMMYANNVMAGIERPGFNLSSGNDMLMEGVLLVGNTIEQMGPLTGPIPRLFAMSPIIAMPNLNTPAESLLIENNSLEYTGDFDAPNPDNRAFGIQLGRCHDMTVVNNDITGTIGPALALRPVNDPLTQLKIQDNQIQNCCRDDGTDLNIHTAVRLNSGPGRLNLLHIEGNTISGGGDNSAIERGIYGTINLDDGTIVNNTMVQVTTHLSWLNTANIVQLHVEHTGSGSPEGVVRASAGSVYTNGETGETWGKEFGGTTANGWVLR